MSFELPPLTPEQEKRIAEPDPNFTFSDAVLRNVIEAVWQFLDNRGAKTTRYERSVERRLELRYLGYEREGEPDEVRMLQIGSPNTASWEIEDHGFTFEFDGGKVTCPTIKSPEKARQELLKMLLSLMAICGTKAEWKESMRRRT